jgi:hypothetical protein
MSARGPRPAIRVEWGTMAFGQSGVSMLNDMAYCRLAKAGTFSCFRFNHTRAMSRPKAPGDAVLFVLHPPISSHRPLKRRTTLGELQELGAWQSEAMVRRYAHFAPEQIRKAADRLATFWYTAPKEAAAEAPQVSKSLVPAAGIGPATFGLQNRCSTN